MIKKQKLFSVGSFLYAGSILLLVFFFVSVVTCTKEELTLDAFEQNKRLGRGGNLGDILYDFDNWDKQWDQEQFDLIKNESFDSVRINTGPFSHVTDNPPYTISSAFYERLDWTINEALSRGFTVIIDNHEYHAMGNYPMENKEKFLSCWKQMAEHYKDYPDNVFFGVLNEPYNNLTPALWNSHLSEVIEVIRVTNPTRILVIGPGRWNSPLVIEELELPEDDRNIIVEFHYYSPHHFTHQGASWSKGSEAWLGMTWRGTPEEKKAVIDDINLAIDWAKRHNRPLYLGEFGVYRMADMESRICWTRFIRETAEENGISWALWDTMGTSFGVYDKSTHTWNRPLLEALIPPE